MQETRVVIAEDDKLIRAGICRMVQRCFSAMDRPPCVIFEAANGREALQACVTNPVDILITDIKMPVMDGLTLVKEVKKVGVSVPILAISGYQDYTYVREMMKQGAYDYLIKPIDERQLYDALVHFVSAFSMGEDANVPSARQEQRLIESLLLQAEGAEKLLDDFLLSNWLQRDFPCEVLFLSLGTSAHENMSLFRAIRAYVQANPALFCVQGVVTLHMVICFSRTGDCLFGRDLVHHLMELGFVVYQQLSLPRASDLTILHQWLYNTFYDMDTQTTSSGDRQAQLSRIVETLLGDTQDDEMEAVVESLFSQYQADQTPVAVIKRELIDVQYQAMARSSDVIEFVSKSKFTDHNLRENFNGVSSLAQLCIRVRATFGYLGKQMQTRLAEKDHCLFSQVFAYIEAHYADNLQLAQVADLEHLHPNYFSALFKQTVGITFREYLRKMRIDVAKAHIIKGELSMSQIAEAVGYGDTAHFFRAFKNMTGMTPTVYRRTQRGTEKKDSKGRKFGDIAP